MAESVVGDRFTAVFEPKRTDDLRPPVRQYVGQRRDWIRMWIIDEGEYTGEWACMPADAPPGLYWVPECDLRKVEGNG